MGNDRNAGRKRKFDTETISKILKSYQKGHSVSELAREYGVSRQTMSFYVNEVACEMEVRSTDGVSSVVRGLAYWKKINESFAIPATEMEKCPMRMDYMRNKEVFTSILVNFKDEQIYIKNFTEHPLKCAFGVKRNPTWEDFNYFLEDRCVPRSRDHMKIILKDYGLDFYDPISIIEKTGGRMAEDDFYLKLYRLEVEHENL